MHLCYRKLAKEQEVFLMTYSKCSHDAFLIYSISHGYETNKPRVLEKKEFVPLIKQSFVQLAVKPDCCSSSKCSHSPAELASSRGLIYYLVSVWTHWLSHQHFKTRCMCGTFSGFLWWFCRSGQSRKHRSWDALRSTETGCQSNMKIYWALKWWFGLKNVENLKYKFNFNVKKMTSHWKWRSWNSY